MKRYTIDIDLWTSISAKDELEAMSTAQWLIDQLVAYSENIDTPIQAQVKDGGIEEE